jgi:UDP-N-acetylglucosamine 2-epimerase
VQKVLTILGTRPEAIKMAPVIQELKGRPREFASVLCSTGQHREMLDQALGFFGMEPDLELGLMTPNQTLAGLTAALLTGLDRVVQEVRPDWILAQGDTTSVLVAGLLSYYHRVPFGHVEAGLRTDDKGQPFPEEMNRRIADAVCDLMFAPTTRCRDALLREGHPGSRIHVTGNTVVDALNAIVKTPYDWGAGPLASVDARRPYVLVTAHRRERFGEPFRSLCAAIRSLALRYPDVQFLYPVHLNPNVRAPVRQILSGVKNVRLAEPLDYRSFVAAMATARLILTDSGGVQEEAPSLGVPVLVMRDKTERPEGVEAGVARLVGTSRERIVDETSRLLDSDLERRGMVGAGNPYGDGHAARRIADLLSGAPAGPS